MFSDEDSNSSSGRNLPNFLSDIEESSVPSRRRSYLYEEDQFEPGSIEFKKAKKRRQNRESAIRSRHRKRADSENLDRHIETLKVENSQLNIQNATLKTENEMLKNEIDFYKRMLES
jgi:hypothetical protein